MSKKWGKPDEESPEWGEEAFRNARPVAERFPELVEAYRRGRGPQRSPTKVLTTIRLDEEVLSYFRRQGKGWQTRMGAALREWIAAHPQENPQPPTPS